MQFIITWLFYLIISIELNNTGMGYLNADLCPDLIPVIREFCRSKAGQNPHHWTFPTSFLYKIAKHILIE